MSTKEIQEQLVDNMKRWQRIENGAVASTGTVIEKTDNPVIRLIMEIIQRDSQMHYRVQEMIADSLTTKAVSMTPDELGAVWDLIEKHIQIEKKTVELLCVESKSEDTITIWCQVPPPRRTDYCNDQPNHLPCDENAASQPEER